MPCKGRMGLLGVFKMGLRCGYGQVHGCVGVQRGRSKRGKKKCRPFKKGILNTLDFTRD